MKTSVKNLVIEPRKGILSWHYVIKSKANDEVICASEVYFSRFNCLRAAKRLGEILKVEVKE